MNIRSVTLFCNPEYSHERMAAFVAAARDGFHVPVQTTRLALPPFPDWWDEETNAVHFVESWQAAGVDYISIGPVQLQHPAIWLARIPGLVGTDEALFATVEIADQHGVIDPARCRAMAAVIGEVGAVRPDGLGNLYLAALANCPPGIPFFPAAYHDGGRPTFAIALEAADVILAAVRSVTSLAEARDSVVSAVEEEAGRLEAAANALAEEHEIAFGGIDFSPAPFPEAERSLAGAMEALGLASVGAHGSLFAAAFLAEALQRAAFRRCGFSGMMLPVLEDSVLAARTGEGQITISDLLSYAAVCGVGLDTIPLPGDISQPALAGILLDIAALAARLDKPLTARLLPMPGKQAGDPIQFDFPYFSDGAVMATRGGITGLLADATRIPLLSLREKR